MTEIFDWDYTLLTALLIFPFTFLQKKQIEYVADCILANRAYICDWSNKKLSLYPQSTIESNCKYMSYFLFFLFFVLGALDQYTLSVLHLFIPLIAFMITIIISQSLFEYSFKNLFRINKFEYLAISICLLYIVLTNKSQKEFENMLTFLAKWLGAFKIALFLFPSITLLFIVLSKKLMTKFLKEENPSKDILKYILKGLLSLFYGSIFTYLWGAILIGFENIVTSLMQVSAP